MIVRPRIGLAVPDSDERSAVAAWLAEGGYDSVELPDWPRVEDQLQQSQIQAVVADIALFARPDEVVSLIRRMGANRPLLLLGDGARLPVSARGEWSLLPRPLDSNAVTLAIGLALAEGRPARRFRRKRVAPIPASAHGMAATVRETSTGGVGLELVGPRAVTLPPYFKLRIPHFGVHVLVKRAWTTQGASRHTRCGGTVEGDLPDASRPWVDFVREAREPKRW